LEIPTPLGGGYFIRFAARFGLFLERTPLSDYNTWASLRTAGDVLSPFIIGFDHPLVPAHQYLN